LVRQRTRSLLRRQILIEAVLIVVHTDRWRDLPTVLRLDVGRLRR
jgi:hypothetical protein